MNKKKFNHLQGKFLVVILWGKTERVIWGVVKVLGDRGIGRTNSQKNFSHQSYILLEIFFISLELLGKWAPQL